MRYFYLIVFADYLLEEMCYQGMQQSTLSLRGSVTALHGHDGLLLPPVPMDVVNPVNVNVSALATHTHRPPIKFSTWLNQRREILNIARKGNQSME
jgi:hypothetical protein